MKFSLAVAVVGIVCFAAADDRQQFEDFKRKFNKVYDSAQEEQKRFDIFQASLQRAAASNAGQGELGAAFGVTKFSDLTPQEFSARLGYRRANASDFSHPAAPLSVPQDERVQFKDLPSSLDWRTHLGSSRGSAVTTVKDQGQCGSCWAFSVAETTESAAFLAGNSLYEFSPQQVASCTPSMFGCGGGDPVPAYESIMSKGGLSSGWFWPYQQSMYAECLDKPCTAKCSQPDRNFTFARQFPFAEISGYSWATPPCETGAKCSQQDLGALADALVQKGPTSICLNAGAWQDYTGGILSSKACGGNGMDDVDHCVQLVGYHRVFAKPEQSYWIVRNSWSTDWGIDGYIHLQLDENTCGLANEASHPTIATEQITKNAYRYQH